MRVASVIIILISICFSSFGQEIIKAPTRADHWFYYKLNEQQAKKYILRPQTPIDSLATDFVAKFHRDSSQNTNGFEHGYYLKIRFDGLTATHELFIQNYFQIVTNGFNGEGQITVANFKGELIRNANIETQSGSVISYKPSCGCYSITETLQNELLKVSANGYFHYMWATSYGVQIPAADKSNPYKGTKIYPGYFVSNKPMYRHFDTLKTKAFLTDWRGKRLKKKVFYYANFNGKYQQIGKAKPTTKGAYVFNFYLNDSIQFNNYYQVDIRLRDSTLLKSLPVKLLDYELNKVVFDISCGPTVIKAGDSFYFRASAYDKNELPVLDARIKYTFSLSRVLSIIPDKLYIPDSAFTELFSAETLIDPTGNSLIYIPDSLYIPGRAQYRLQIAMVSATGQNISRDYNVTYLPDSQQYSAFQIGQKMHFVYSQRGKNIAKPATLKTFYRGVELWTKEVELPYEHTLTPNEYAFHLFDGDSLILQKEAVANVDLKIEGTRTSDSFSLKVKSPNEHKTTFFYRLYANRELVEEGEGIEFNFNTNDKSLASYYLIYGYYWHGSNRVFEQAWHLKEKELKVEINQPEKIFPGEYVPIAVKVSNYKGKPQGDVNLTAWAVNNEFGNIPMPQLPYFGRRFPQLLRNTNFSVTHARATGSQLITNTICEHFNLHKYPYYQWSFPGKHAKIFNHKLEYKEPEFFPFVMKNGLPIRIEYIKLNDELVFLGKIYRTPKAAIRHAAGTFKLSIRTTDTLIVVNDFELVDSFKTILSLDVEHAEKNIEFKDALNGRLNQAELDDLSRSLLFFQVPVNLNDTIWVYQNNKTTFHVSTNYLYQPIQIPQVANYFYQIPGMNPGPAVISIAGDSFFINFNHNNYYVWQPPNSYQKTAGLLKAYPIPERPINWEYFATTNTNNPSYYWLNHYAYRTQREIRNRAVFHTKPKPSPNAPSKPRNYYLESLLPYNHAPSEVNNNEILKTQVRVFNPGFHSIDKKWLFNKEHKDWIWANSYNSRGEASYYLPFGNYELVMLKNMGKIQVQAFEVKKGFQLYMNVQNDGFKTIEEPEEGLFEVETPSNSAVEGYRKRVHEVCRPAFGETDLYPLQRKVMLVKSEKKPGEKASVLGVVKDYYSGQRITNVEVILEQEGVFVNSQKTNSWGEFLFEDLPQGSFQVKLRYSGYYYTLLYNVKLVKERRQNIQVLMLPWQREEGKIIAGKDLKVTDTLRLDAFEDVEIAEEKIFSSQGARDYNESYSKSRSSYSDESYGAAPMYTNASSSYGADYYDDYDGEAFQWNSKPKEVSIDNMGTYEVVKQNGNEDLSDEKRKMLGLENNLSRKELEENLQARNKGRLRDNFKDYAFWVPNLETDPDGMAYFTVQYPDNITSWQTIVPAMDGRRQTGLGLATTKAYLPITAQLGLPRFLVEGDSVDIISKVYNYTDSATMFRASVSLNDSVVDAFRQKSEGINVKKTRISHSEVGDLDIQFVMKTDDGFLDGEKRTIPVKTSEIERVETQDLKLTAKQEVSIVANNEPTQVIIYNQEQQLLLEKAVRLKNYHYGCNEQTASKLMAVLLEKQLYQQTGQAFNDNQLILDLINRLSSTQNKNGSWGWWQNNDADNWMTIYITDVLSKAAAQGYDSRAYNKGMQYVTRKYKAFATTNKLKAMQMMLNWSLMPDTTGYSSIKRGQLGMYESLLTVNIDQMLGLKVNLQKRVLEKAQIDPTGVVSWSGYSYRYNSNATMSTLLAYKAIQYANDTQHFHWLRAIENGLLYGQSSSYNTLEQASILGLMAQNKKKAGNYPTIWVNGKKHSEFPIVLEMNDTDTAKLKMEGEGFSPVSIYRTVTIKNAEADSGFFEVFTKLSQAGNESNNLNMGKPSTLSAKVENRLSAKHVMIEIPIPAGCSYVNQLERTLSYESHREYFKDRVVIFCENLPPGSHTFNVSIDPRFTGKYTLVPATAQLMYFPHKMGNSATKKVEIGF
ncbi:MAG: hypothetical protein KDC92_06715 [Bacteroidetes bacterium]|nr:hypothetical protein [Bacteroidota bacterium]